MARIEVVRDHWPEDKNGVSVWIGKDEAAYSQWLTGDPDTPMDKPKPTLVIPSEDVDRIVIGWLRGSIGPVGPPGMMGASAPGAE